jgi:hypothetical protein
VTHTFRLDELPIAVDSRLLFLKSYLASPIAPPESEFVPSPGTIWATAAAVSGITSLPWTTPLPGTTWTTLPAGVWVTPSTWVPQQFLLPVAIQPIFGSTYGWLRIREYDDLLRRHGSSCEHVAKAWEHHAKGRRYRFRLGIKVRRADSTWRPAAVCISRQIRQPYVHRPCARREFKRCSMDSDDVEASSDKVVHELASWRNQSRVRDHPS